MQLVRGGVTMTSIPSKLDKCTGAMLASAIGDALGWPNEFRFSTSSKRLKVNDFFIEWSKRCGRYPSYDEKILPGEYSDDTQMILSVARSIIAGDWENIFFSKELPFWLEYERGGGRALKKAAMSYKKGIKPWQTNYPHDYFSAGGNGAVMRILPHVITTAKGSNIDELMTNTIKDSIITHGHPRAILGATCYAYALDYLLRKESVLEYGELVTAIIDGQNVWGAFPDQSAFDTWREVAVRASGYDYMDEWDSTLIKMLKQFDFIKIALKKGLMLDDKEVLTSLECFGKTKGAGDVTIWAAIYFASKYANNPVLGIKAPAFLFGADTDTIASISGGLLGMLCGVNWIPMEWKAIQDYECLIRMTELLLSDNMKEAAKDMVVVGKKQYDDWKSTPIGKMRLIGTSTIQIGKTSSVTIIKRESTLGQTLYFKKYERSNYDSRQPESQMLFRFESLSETVKHDSEQKMIRSPKSDPQFLLTADDVLTLLKMSPLKRITFKKVLQIIYLLLSDEKTNASIAKQMDVESSTVDCIRTYIKDK